MRSPQPATIDILFIESSIGLSGSTVSLCSLLNYLDSDRFLAHIVLSRPEQEGYMLGQLRRPGDLTVIAPGRSLKHRATAQAMLDYLGRRAPLLRRPLLTIIGALDVFAITIPYALRLRRFAKGRGIKLIHQNNGFDLGALILSFVLRVPLVAYQRGDEWPSLVVRWLARRVRRFIANSATTKANLVSLGVSPDKIRVIYPPLDLATFAPGRRSIVTRATFGVDPTAPCFGIIGLLVPWKGHDVFLKAAKRVFERIPGARAFVVGGAPPHGRSYEMALRDLAHELGIADRVIFTGFRADIPDMLTVLDIVAHTSVRPEPFGRVIAEAMAMKRPVIASKAGGPTEIIEDGKTGFLVEPGDDKALADRLIVLLNDPTLAQHIGRAGYEVATQRFSADTHAQLVQRVYEDVLGPRRSRAARRRRSGPLRSSEALHKERK